MCVYLNVCTCVYTWKCVCVGGYERGCHFLFKILIYGYKNSLMCWCDWVRYSTLRPTTVSCSQSSLLLYPFWIPAFLYFYSPNSVSIPSLPPPLSFLSFLSSLFLSLALALLLDRLMKVMHRLEMHEDRVLCTANIIQVTYRERQPLIK